jgi:hypothetical protein
MNSCLLHAGRALLGTDVPADSVSGFRRVTDKNETLWANIWIWPGCPLAAQRLNGAWRQWRLVVAQLKLGEMVIDVAREHTAPGFGVQE